MLVVLCLFAIFFFFFLFVSIQTARRSPLARRKTQDYVFRYDDQCGAVGPCNITLKVERDMPAPVYFYYRLTKYYQNHRRYVKSRDDRQLKGEVLP
jgi:hypothetical protein